MARLGEFMPKTIAVIDGNSIMHRAFHAVPPTMTAPDGTPTNAAFGFMSMLLKFIEEAQPDAIICAFDAGRPAFRMEAIEQYKAQRPPMDDNLKQQFPLVENLLEAMNIPVIRIKGWEGDDILGTIAARDEALGYRSLLVTGDKDAYQLASNLTQIVTTKKGISDVALYGPDEVMERYGIRPDQVPDFLGLKGDPSDNIPGVPGIGPKTAMQLLQKYETLEGIYENLSAFKGKRLENLTNHKQDAYDSRKVATIIRDLDFDIDLESVVFPDFNPEEVTQAFNALRFSTHLKRVLRLAGQEGHQSAERLLKLDNVLSGEEAVNALDKAIEAQQLLGISAVVANQASLFGDDFILAVSTDSEQLLFEEDAKNVFAKIVKKAHFATNNLKDLLHNIYPKDTSLQALISDEDLRLMNAFDAELAAYNLNSSGDDFSVAHLLDVYANQEINNDADEKKTALLKAKALRILKEKLTAELKHEGSYEAYFEIDMPLVAVLCIMERTGAAIDVEKLHALGEVTQKEIEQLRTRIIDLAGEEFNVDSPKQLSHILFEVLGLRPIKKTKSGYSTNAAVLKELEKDHEIPSLVLRYRELSKINSTYIEALPRMCAGDGRLHSSFNESVTTTGRLSSSDPNLQNIPVRTDFGRKIRECFIPLQEGELFVSADYSQIELRLLAHLSQDKGLIEAFCSGADFHAQTASHVFGIPVEEITPELRSRAKAVNFGIVYGQQAYGLSQSLDIPFGEAKDMIDRYFEVYPGVREYLDNTIDQARACGYAETMFGRKRHIPELSARAANVRSFGERTAMNHPMQGSAADIIKLAMTEVSKRVAEEGLRAKLMIQVHDELDFSVPQEEVETLSALVKEVMEHVVELKVPLTVDINAATTWAEAH